VAEQLVINSNQI